MRNLKFHLLFFLTSHPTTRQPVSPRALAQLYQVHQMKMEIAKKELQNALRPIRGKRVEKAELDALVEKILDGTRTKTDGTSVPNTTWEYLLRSEILSLAVRLSLSFFLSAFDYQGLTQASVSPSVLPPCFVKSGHRG